MIASILAAPLCSAADLPPRQFAHPDRIRYDSHCGGSELPILRVDRGDILAGFALKYRDQGRFSLLSSTFFLRTAFFSCHI